MRKIIVTTAIASLATSIAMCNPVFANEQTDDSSSSYVRTNGMQKASVLKGEVNVKPNDPLNVRALPDASSKKLFELQKGSIVNVLNKESNGWLFVEYKGEKGYVNGAYVRTYTETVPDTYKTAVTTDAINLRKSASWSAEKIMVISKNSKVNVVSKNGEWTQVNYNGNNGYAPTSYLSFSSDNTNSGGGSQAGEQVTPMNAKGEVSGLKSGETLNVREGSDTSYKVKFTLTKGQKVNVEGKASNGWYKINFNGQTGFASNKFIKIINTAQPGDENTSNPYVTTDKVNLRKSKSWSSDAIMFTINKGETVNLISKDSDWAKVSYKSSTGYVPLDYITSQSGSNENSTPDNPSNSIIGKIGTVTASSLNIRSGPNTNYSILTKISNGDTVLIKEVASNGWYKVELVNGIVGWCSNDYIGNIRDGKLPDIGSPSERVQKVIDVAKAQLGKPYVWGDTGPNSFDCSGLTLYSYKNGAGITLPRVSRDQAKAGSYVSKSSLKPGDLVFFDHNGGSNINHVGIYLGNNQMIHSPSSGKTVSIVNINTNYWIKNYVTARRIIN